MFWQKKPEPPICEDCLWYRHNDYAKYARCANPRNKPGAIKLVSRAPLATEDYAFCDISRGSDYRCGPSGRFFDAKPPAAPKPAPDPYRGVLDNIDCTLLRIARTLEQPPKPKRK